MPSVLVVDDDIDLLEMVELALTNHQMKVNCLNHGATLFDSIEKVNPDIILMDIYLGDMDGRNLCYKLKTSEKLQHIPVILYSAGYITPTSIQESMADEFLVKPFDIGQLIKKVTSLV